MGMRDEPESNRNARIADTIIRARSHRAMITHSNREALMQPSLIQPQGAKRRGSATPPARPDSRREHRRSCEPGPRTPPFTLEPFVASIGPGKTVLTCRTGQTLFTQGDSAEAVFYLQAGLVKLTVVSPQGKEAVVAIMGPDSFFGEACLAGQQVYFSTASALTPCTLVRIEKQAMSRVLQGEPTVAERFLSFLLARTIRVQEDLVDQLLNSSERRLARALLLLARSESTDDPQPVIPKISQETLAEMVGTTRSRVSHFMNKFKQLGYIQYDNSGKSDIYIHSSLSEVIRQI